MTDLDGDFDPQDQSEVFDEDNTNLEETQYGGVESVEQFEDLPDVYDVTRAVGDDDDEAALIAEELDDEDIVALEDASDQDDADLEDDDLAPRGEARLAGEDDLDFDADPEDLDEVDGVTDLESDEVELEYAGDLNDLENAESAAQDLESHDLSNEDLEELDYRDEDGVR